MAELVEVYTLNAFVADGRGGNPAGVVLNADSLTDKQMQEIAKELGLSETAFVLSSENANYRVRFFTPVEEVDFCGHATVATYSALWQLERLTSTHITQETRAGKLSVEVKSDGKVVFETAQPVFGSSYQPEDLTALFGLKAEDVLSTGLPIKLVSTGLPDVILPVASEDVLNNLTPDLDAIAEFNRQTSSVGFYVFALTPQESDVSAKCRSFSPLLGIDEESATGSAAGALAAYLHRYQGTHSRYVFEQGENLGLRSLIAAYVSTEQDVLKQIQVGGYGSKLERQPYRKAG